MKRRNFLKLGGGALVTTALSACGGNDADGNPAPTGTPVGLPDPPPPPQNVVAGWTRTALEAIRSARPGPPMAARSLAVMYTCMYNSWCNYDPVAQPTRPDAGLRQVPALHTQANKAMAMSYAAHAALIDQFPAQAASFDAFLDQLGYHSWQAVASAGAPAQLGSDVARIEIAYCHVDGSNQLGLLAPGGVPYADYTGYLPANPPLVVAEPTPLASIPAPGRWQPLTYLDATGTPRTPVFLAAAWEKVRPFALASSSQYRPGPPAAFGTREYQDQAARIVELTASLSEEQKFIAEYWSDGPGTDLPPGHWLQIGLFVSARDRHTDDDDIKMFFALANALSDTAIAAWDAKRAYDSERPITAIRYLYNSKTIQGYGPLGPAGGLRPILGASWVPYQPPSFPTPPFPEHVSGHSAFSSAAAEVLRCWTGSDAFGGSALKPARTMVLEPGLPSSDLRLDWATFTQAALQAGMSRIWGGIHFDQANSAGATLGRAVGARVYEKAQSLWEGRA